MSAINAGGPAFPTTFIDKNPGEEEKAIHRSGMALRDYFAAKAMQGLIAYDATDTDSYYARQAYAIADAMIAEIAK